MALNKRAQMNEIITGAAVLIFIIFLIIFFKRVYGPEQTKAVDFETCRLSVLKSTLPTQGINSILDLKGCKLFKNEIDDTEPDAVHEILATDIANCWNAYGAGKADFLKYRGGKRDICIPCTKKTFLSSVDVNKQSFEDYLKNSEDFKLNTEPNIFLNDQGIKENDAIYTIIIASRVKEYDWFDYLTLAPIDITRQLYYYTYGTEFRSSVILLSGEKLKDNCKTI